LDQLRISEAVAHVRSRISSAGGNGVALIAVTKTFGPDAWLLARAAGCDGVGENYAQEVLTKAEAVPRSNRPPVHFIGQLQTNKIKQLADIVDVWQSVDRASVITEIAKRVKRPDVGLFIQVNTTEEDHKGGCSPSDLAQLVKQAMDAGLLVNGLMTVGPTDADPLRTRSAFSLLRTLADEHGLKHRSMGMTGDLEIAIEEGSTMVRIGSAIFGNRPSPQQ
jgi:pyridoxal phosphate enzyme (YggS family)